MTDVSDRDHDAFANPAKMAGSEGNLRATNSARISIAVSNMALSCGSSTLMMS